MAGVRVATFYELTDILNDLQLDDIWGFVFKKEGHKWLSEANNQRIGDAYTFIALERDSKLVVALRMRTCVNRVYSSCFGF